MSRKPTVTEVLPLVKKYYAKSGNEIGGSLHLVLEDGNTSTTHVEYCLRFAQENNDIDGIVLAELLLKMSRTQRGVLYVTNIMD